MRSMALRLPRSGLCYLRNPSCRNYHFRPGTGKKSVIDRHGYPSVNIDRLTYLWEWRCVAGEDISDCKSPLAEIMPPALPPQSKKGFGDLFAAVRISQRSHSISRIVPLDTINFAGRTRNISLKFEHTAPQNQDTSLAVELKDPRPAPFGNDTPEEKPRPMDIIPKGIARNSDSYPCGLILLLRGPTKNSEDLAMTTIIVGP